MRPRAIVSPIWAMARPRRPTAEVDAVKAAASEIGGGRSVQCTAAAIARRVTADLLKYLDDEPVLAALSELRALTDGSPFAVLATCPHIDTAALILERRKERFVARGCRQLGAAAWSEETRTIAADVEQQLTGRYAKLLRSK